MWIYSFTVTQQILRYWYAVLRLHCVECPDVMWIYSFIVTQQILWYWYAVLRLHCVEGPDVMWTYSFIVTQQILRHWYAVLCMHCVECPDGMWTYSFIVTQQILWYWYAVLRLHCVEFFRRYEKLQLHCYTANIVILVCCTSSALCRVSRPLCERTVSLLHSKYCDIGMLYFVCTV